jgi:hypothetical protein
MGAGDARQRIICLLAIDRPQVVGRYSVVDIEPDRMPGHIDNDAAAVSMRISGRPSLRSYTVCANDLAASASPILVELVMLHR